MSSLVEFVGRLLDDGEVLLRERPSPSVKQRAEAAGFLEKVYADRRLEVAGPLIDFDREAATAAAEFVWQACWFLVSHREPDSEMRELLVMPAGPTTAAQHLSADMMLRYVPQLLRRARSQAPDDPLVEQLNAILRQWPLSGVLADVSEPPVGSLDFERHPGLMLLYAERYAENARQAWMPVGDTGEYVELVLQEMSKTSRGTHLEQ